MLLPLYIRYLVCMLMPAQPLQDSARGPRGELYIRKAAPPTPPKLSTKPEKDPAGSQRESSWIESRLQPVEISARARSQRAARVGRTVSAFSDFFGQGGKLYLATIECCLGESHRIVHLKSNFYFSANLPFFNLDILLVSPSHMK